ncbi:MAG: ABC transporter substrate-binding protein [Candidatus Binatia bacterium]|nr:ABC transporter substrate-binding protein [Candidatus Binatia bacterium]
MTRSCPSVLIAFALATGLCLSGCPSAGEDPESAAPPASEPVAAAPKADKGPPAPPPPPAAPISYEIPVATWDWDVDAGDTSVPANQGGPGFTGVGWGTRNEGPVLGSPEAVRGGTARLYLPDWPPTLRQAGENWNTSFNYMAGALLYESLLSMNPFTLQPTPALATHWWVSEDKTTYRFRLNPMARFSNGEEVTANDVVASWKLRVDPGLREPSSVMTFGKLHEPTVLSKYIVEVKVKEESWRNFLYFSGMTVFPASSIGDITGEEYLDRYQFDYVPGSGPYIIHKADIDQGKSITLRRRDDYWDENNPTRRGTYNIENYEYAIVKDPGLAFEKVKKGELDIYTVSKAQWWAEEVPKIDAVKRGMLQPRKIWNDRPMGTSGIAINMQKLGLSDLRVRRALQFLYNRELMIEKLFFGEYSPLDSYYQGGVYQNPDNPHMPYDPLAAVELLEEAGWTEINPAGYRVKDGQELRFNLVYSSSQLEPSLTLFQEDAKQAGFAIDLQLLTPAALWKALQQKEYQLSSIAWGALVFPNPETSFSSDLADKHGNNNITAFKNDRVDALCEEYDTEYDVARRIEIIREVDGLVYEQQPYILGWYLAPLRLLYSNKFKMPAWGIGPLTDGSEEHYLWWIDPEQEKLVDEARRDTSKSLPLLPVENRYWQEWHKHQDG